MERQEIEKLLKVQALALAGSDGERQNAQRVLTRLLEKHGITEEDLRLLSGDIEEIQELSVSYHTTFEKRLFVQIVGMVTNREGKVMRTVGSTRLSVELSASDKIKVETLYDFYASQWRAEVKTLFTAFLYTHNLFPESKVEDSGSEKGLTEEETKKLLGMMVCLDKVDRPGVLQLTLKKES